MDALSELRAKPGILILDDITGLGTGALSTNWTARLTALKEYFEVSSPVLPFHKRHADKGGNADDLLPLLRSEINRLSRPLAAVVDMQWQFCDKNEGKAPWFGLEMIRLLKRAKPSLPIFVWSPIQDKHVLQRAMQLGASSYFDKPQELRFNHDLPADSKDDPTNELDAGKLWFRLLEWEMARYQCPPVDVGNDGFILADTPESIDCRKRFLTVFKLTESDLLAQPKPAVERLLRALVPDAVGVEILRFFGEGQSGLERPFVVRGRTASGRWLRPIQIKLSHDWRALAREGKGYRDVFAGCLGPSVSHIIAGPYRLQDWCGMAQSFAAPEEAIRDISSKSTRSLEAWLRESLPNIERCQELVDGVFDGVLDPLYKENLTERGESVIKAFNRVSPAHFERPFVPAEQSRSPELGVDLTPANLSRKNPEAQREAAYRAWKKVEDWWNGDGKDKFTVNGMAIDTLEIDVQNPRKSRLRLLDPTLGIKVDLFANDDNVARRWESLERSPIKLVGMPVSFAIEKPNKAKEGGNQVIGSTENPNPWEYLLTNWTTSIGKLLGENGILEVAADMVSSEIDPKKQPNRYAWGKIVGFFHASHPIDWTERFHIGPTHGDLNLGNVLLNEKGKSLFPWLIDFDKAADQRPVVFDLAKLEIEAYHKLAHELFWELMQTGSIGTDQDMRDLILCFEQALETRGVADIEHLWERFEGRKAIPESLRNRFSGLFVYLKQVNKRVRDLGVTRREFLIGKVVYSLCCLKFKHLYKADIHPNAPFPAKVILWKLEALLNALDAENGIVWDDAIGAATQSCQQKAVSFAVRAVRQARVRCDRRPLGEVLGSVFASKPFSSELSALPFYSKARGWQLLLRILRDKQVPGKNRWIRELLWYARDFGVEDKPEELGLFTKAMAEASQDIGESLPKFDQALWDYASTGRPGNAYPSTKMFEHLAQRGAGNLIKISSRGESGGTIDILEQVGIPICTSRFLVDQELRERNWAVVETSEYLCEVDKILMKIRKDCHCMKVPDLAISSISAKKAALGIANFRVQIASGYDTKFPEFEASDLGTLTERWQRAWKSICPGGKVITESDVFDSDRLKSWFTTKKTEYVVFGKKLLAADIWDKMSREKRRSLGARLPGVFCSRLTELANSLRELILKFEEPGFGSPFLDLSMITAPRHLKGLRVVQGDRVFSQDGHFSDLSLIVFKFAEDVRDDINVPFFDGLYSEISFSGHPLSSLIFGKRWLAVIRPRSDLRSDLPAWCWKILREGFEGKL